MCTPVHGLSVCSIAEKPEFRVPEYTFSLLTLNLVHFGFFTNLVHFGFCTNLVRFRSICLNRLVERTGRVGVYAQSYKIKGCDGESEMGGVNLFRSHYSLVAKYRDSMYRGKYSAVIGLEQPIAWTFLLGTCKKKTFSDQSQRCISPRKSKHEMSPNDSVSDSG